MATIKQQDFIQSIADGFQFIATYHPVGGAAYLVSKAIRASRVMAFQDLGMEAIHEFDVKDMPVTVAVDTTGNAAHESGPREWRAKIGKIPVTVA